MSLTTHGNGIKGRHWWLAPIVIAIVLSVAGARPPDKACCGFVSVPLRALAKGDLGKYWTLKSAELRETPSATWGYVAVQNSSYAPTESARFYGEYFDAEGRFCFSLAFSLASNEEGKNAPIRPAELRTLRSLAGSITPAVAPKELRLYLVEQTSLIGQHVGDGRTPPLRVPPIISGGMPESLSSLTLTGDLAPGDDSIRDLVLARVRVDSLGHPETVDILQAMSDKLRQWLQDFVTRTNGFAPAIYGETPVAGDTLILVRAFTSRNGFGNTDFLPRLSPWVAAYVAGVHENEVPAVSVLFFEPLPTRVKRLGSTQWVDLPPPPPGLFRSAGSSAEWCPGLFDYQAGRVPGQFVLEWRK